MQISIHLVRRDPINNNVPGATTTNSNASTSAISPGVLNENSNNLPLNSCQNSANAVFPVPKFPKFPEPLVNGAIPTATRRPMAPVLSAAAQQAAESPSNHQSSLDARLITFIPPYDRNAFKIAFYTVLLLVFTALGGVGVWCIYHLLYAFLKPMLWAVLMGTVLFPVKQSVTNVSRGWLRGLRTSHTPLIVGVVCLPLQWLDAAAESLFSLLTSKSQCAATVGGFIAIKLLMFERVFLSLVDVLARIYALIDNIILFVTANPWILPAIVLYSCIYLAWLFVQDAKPNKKVARVLSLPIWFFGLVTFASYTGPLRVLVLLASSVTIALLAAGLIAYNSTKEEGTQTKRSPSPPVVTSPDGSTDGDRLLKGMAGACALMFAAKHVGVLLLLLVPLVYGMLKRASIRFGVSEKLRLFFCEKSNDAPTTSSPSDGAGDASTASPPTTIYARIRRLYDVTVPHTLRDFAKFVFYRDQNVIYSLESSMDLVSSVVVIIALVVGMLFTTFFVLFQLHNETVHLARLGTNVFHEMKEGHASWMSVAANFTESQLGDTDVDELVEQAYTQARVWLTAQVRQLADPSDPDRADMLEGQVQQLIDNLYEMWEHRQDTAAVQMTTAGEEAASTDLWTHLSKATDLGALKEQVTLIVKENVGTLLAVAEGVWAVLSSNVAFIVSLLGGLVGLLLSFGVELLNFIIELVVFFTMLYYLLVCSGDQFKPMELISHVSIKPNAGVDESPNRSVTAAVEQSISEVFLLSAKMSAFYGMYTWFIHSLFTLNVVFTPSVLALVLAAVPLTAPSWVCFVGVAELCLVRGECVAALLFFLASVAPMMFADTAFYNEVKGTHPYVTGLAIVGGMYWLGLQGAIIGPILLCCFTAVVNVYTNIL